MSAPTASDEFLTPYSASELPYQKMPGVVVQAQMVSQILSAVLDERPLLWVLPTWGEWIWIWVASGVAGIMVWRWRHSVYGRLVTVGAIAVLYVACFGVLIVGGWMPLVPSALALIFTGSLIIAYSQLHG
jgi:CHASE2 domain-containing sensor protein